MAVRVPAATGRIGMVLGEMDRGETEDRADRVEVAKLGRTHGLDGEIYIRILSDVPDRVRSGSVLVDESGEEVRLRGVRQLGNGAVAAIEGVDSVEAAKKLVGKLLYAERMRVEGLTFIDELIGSSVVDSQGINRGKVEAIQANPASELLVLDDGSLVPTVFISELENGVILLDEPAGLFEL